MKKINNVKQVTRLPEINKVETKKEVKEEEVLEETIKLGGIPFATYEKIRNSMIGIK